jgi:hypothetical protein
MRFNRRKRALNSTLRSDRLAVKHLCEKSENPHLAEIEWKGAIWKAAVGDLSIKDLLTTLKGYGPTEILEFDKSGGSRGQISLCLSEDGVREVTIHDLKICGGKRKGSGRKAVRWLRTIFKGDVYVDYPEFSSKEEALTASLPFWVKMYREGFIDGLEGGIYRLYPEMDEAQINRIEQDINSLLSFNRAASGGDESQR